MKFKPWRRRDPFSSSRSLFKVLPSFFLSHQVQTGYCWVGVAQWKCSIGFILFFRQCSLLYMQTASRRVSARAPGSLRPKNGLRGEGRSQQQRHHTKKRAWPFRFSFRIFPRRCLAVAIPFLGRLPFVAWLLIGGGFDAGLLVGCRGTEKEDSPADLSGLTASETKPELCRYFPLCRPEPLLSTELLLCSFGQLSDTPSFRTHFWPLPGSWRLNLVAESCLAQEGLLTSGSSVLTGYPHCTGLS